MTDQQPARAAVGSAEEQPWRALPAHEVVAALDASAERGLTTSEAAARLTRWGPNRLRETPGPSMLARLGHQLNDLLIWVLVGAALISGALNEWIDAGAILAIVLLNAALGLVQEQRAEQALAALRQPAAPTARAVRDGALQTLPAADLVPGDLLELEAGDRLPADARLLVAYALSVDESTLTGESLPVDKAADTPLAPDTPLAERETMLFAGTVIGAGHARAVVTATGMRTELGQLAGLVQTAGLEETPLQRRLNQVGRWLVVAALLVCAGVFGLGLARGIDPTEMFLTAISLAVAAVPEGLPAVVTIVLALGTQRMARQRAIVRRLPAVEALGSTTVICSDKTGTLTQNVMRVLAVAQRPGSPLGGVAEVERDLTLLGLIGLQDPPRPEAGPAVAACRAAGIQPVMITGDQPRTARAIGRELGLLEADDRVVTGAEIDAMDGDALRAALPEVHAYARVTGAHKLRIVRAWRRQGEVVTMTGDGVNDAPTSPRRPAIWCWPTITSPPSSPPWPRDASSPTTSARCCASCSRATRPRSPS